MDPYQPDNQTGAPVATQPPEVVTPPLNAGSVPVSDMFQPMVPIAPAEPATNMPAFMRPDPVMAQTAPEEQLTPAAAAALAGENPNRKYLVAFLLSYFLGLLGGDRFYLGKTASGVAKLLTLGGLGTWYIIDVFLIAFGRMTAQDDRRPLAGFARDYHWVKIMAVILTCLSALAIGGFIILVVIATANGMRS